MTFKERVEVLLWRLELYLVRLPILLFFIPFTWFGDMMQVTAQKIEQSWKPYWWLHPEDRRKRLERQTRPWSSS